MADIENIKDTISKLLALANSPNEHEAYAALLKARELMAKHKLQEADVKPTVGQKAIMRLTSITCTKMTNTWAVRLSAIIAEQYCCRAYRNRGYGAKKVTIGLVGLEDDIDICERIFTYAFDCVAAGCKRIKERHKHAYKPATIRNMMNVYGNGFCDGVQEAYRKQDKSHKEYGLVLVTPQAVADVMARMGKGGSYGTLSDGAWYKRFAQHGYQDGAQFDPSTKLPT